MFRSIGFIGTGNMGSALARAAYKGKEEGAVLWLSNRSPAKADALAQQLPGTRVSTNADIAATCDMIFLGVKPQMMAGMLEPLRPILAARKDRFVICSMAAGVTMEVLPGLLGGDYPLIRILPNTPAAIGAGIAQFTTRGLTVQEKEAFCALLAPSGILDEMDEAMMVPANCVSGCGPAFCSMFIEALADGAVACGLPRDKALTAAAQTLVGTGALYLDSLKHPGAMKDAVCSPGGVTIQGVRCLEQHGFRSAAMEAVITAVERTMAMQKKD